MVMDGKLENTKAFILFEGEKYNIVLVNKNNGDKIV